VVDAKWQAEIDKKLPELPEALRRRLVEQYGITEDDAHTLSATQRRAEQFEEAATKAKNPKRVANLILTELLGRLRGKGIALEQSPISMAGVVQSADLTEAGTLSSKMLKDLYDKCFETGEDFAVVYEREKPQQISDTSELEKIIDEVIANNPKQLEQYRGGKSTVMAYFVGQVMKASKGKANPALVNELLPRKLQG
jgi:aspartyl-tRNA(Asn)/glutamyl-tRNA(Gln) amidotransferase subunit B